MLIMCTLGCTGGSVMAGLGWYSALHKDETYLTRNQEISVIFASLSYTVLAIISLFGLIGTIMQRRSYISLYNTVIWLHLAFNIVAGAFFIYTLFHKVGDEDLSNCFFYCSDDIIAQFDCVKEFEVYRNVIICLYVIFCLLEFWVCLVVAGYMKQLREQEEALLDYPPPAQKAATIQPMATTYNWREYAVTDQNATIDV